MHNKQYRAYLYDIQTYTTSTMPQMLQNLENHLNKRMLDKERKMKTALCHLGFVMMIAGTLGILLRSFTMIIIGMSGVAVYIEGAI